MDFTFTDDQLLFRDTVRDFLVHEVTPERIVLDATGSDDQVRGPVNYLLSMTEPAIRPQAANAGTGNRKPGKN